MCSIARSNAILPTCTGPVVVIAIIGRLGIEVNQYNNPIECYADETIDDMREEKVIIDHPELADKLLKGNTQKHKDHQMNPIAAQKLKSANFDPKRSAVMMAINAQ